MGTGPLSAPPSCALGINQYALVAYIPDPLGEFLYNLRQEIVPTCRLRSHVSVLPPRPLGAPEADARKQVVQVSERAQAFQVVLGDVEVFTKSQVIYIAVRRGAEPLIDLHEHMNRNALYYNEPYPYHPHITLGQELTSEQFSRAVELAQRRWAEWKGQRHFWVENMVFVQNTDGCGWRDLEVATLEVLGVKS